MQGSPVLTWPRPFRVIVAEQALSSRMVELLVLVRSDTMTPDFSVATTKSNDARIVLSLGRSERLRLVSAVPSPRSS